MGVERRSCINSANRSATGYPGLRRAEGKENVHDAARAYSQKLRGIRPRLSLYPSLFVASLPSRRVVREPLHIRWTCARTSRSSAPWSLTDPLFTSGESGGAQNRRVEASWRFSHFADRIVIVIQVAARRLADESSARGAGRRSVCVRPQAALVATLAAGFRSPISAVPGGMPICNAGQRPRGRPH